MKVVWDAPKRKINLARHGYDFADARERFEWATALIEPTYPGKNGDRFLALGFLDDELVALVFSPLGREALSLISLRAASRKERNRYDDR